MYWEQVHEVFVSATLWQLLMNWYELFEVTGQASSSGGTIRCHAIKHLRATREQMIQPVASHTGRQEHKVNVTAPLQRLHPLIVIVFLTGYRPRSIKVRKKREPNT